MSRPSLQTPFALAAAAHAETPEGQNLLAAWHHLQHIAHQIEDEARNLDGPGRDRMKADAATLRRAMHTLDQLITPAEEPAGGNHWTDGEED